MPGCCRNQPRQFPGRLAHLFCFVFLCLLLSHHKGAGRMLLPQLQHIYFCKSDTRLLSRGKHAPMECYHIIEYTPPPPRPYAKVKRNLSLAKATTTKRQCALCLVPHLDWHSTAQSVPAAICQAKLFVCPYFCCAHKRENKLTDRRVPERSSREVQTSAERSPGSD